MKSLFNLLVIWALIFISSIFASSRVQAASRALPTLKIDPNGISVSGISAGGFMALQLQVAYSSLFSGVGVFAGGLYGCAEASVMQAQLQCMAFPDQLSPTHYIDLAKSEEQAGHIDPLSNLSHRRFFLFAGSRDTVVKPVAAQKLSTFLKAFSIGANIQEKFDIPANHGMPTADYGNACSTLGTPWLLNCSFDGAGAALSHIYGPLKAKTLGLDQNLLEFDQTLYTNSESLMGSSGYIYVPTACAQTNKTCRLHLALHGCEQSPDNMGNTYSTKAGYNEWAEANDIVVLYPSVQQSSGNPKSCWDWWGYTGSDYYTRNGQQMKSLRQMLHQISGL